MKRELAPVLTALILCLPPADAEGAAKKEKEVAAPGGRPSFAETVEGLERRDGLVAFWVDDDAGKIWLEIPAEAWTEPLELLYIEALESGLGSNPVGLDRGQLGPTRVVRLRPVGGKLLIEERNLGYRALSENPREVAAVESSFATSVLWAGPIATRDDDGTGLVDLTTFLLRDAHEVVRTLEETEQGTFQLDAERSAVDLDACLAFPDNVELTAVLTYGGKKVGEHVRSTAPTADSVTLVQHHSFVRLPPEGYHPRPFDPRAGSFAIRFADYAADLAAPLEKRWIVRHRLEKTDPTAASSPVVEPIVYYVDSGAP
ncbi:MAG: DUF5117 domain-containing protein, partial [Thermoanaerobaculia bacterium]|nr:DUF5117 domain-containing protein [Thermoanaerobaculia bacterium]